MNQKLLNDAVQFIHIYSTIGESSVRNYPRNGEVTMRFISLLLLTSSGFEFSQNNGSGSGLHSSIDRTNSLRTGNLISFAFLRNQDTFNNLVQRVIDLAFHIAAHPFPSKYLPSLPNELVERQEQKISRSSHVSVNYCDGRSWWDRIPQSGANNDSCSNAVYLPDPPGVSDDSDFFIKNTNNINEQISEQRWTDEMYMHSISAARILELCLTFLIVQVNSSGRDLKLDSVSIGKALCRNTIAVQAIDDRLRNIRNLNVGELSSMMDLTNLGNLSNNQVERSKELKLIEGQYLEKLGMNLANCVEKLLRLSLYQIQSLALLPKNNKALKEAVIILTVSLNYTQIESMVAGCINLFKRSEETKKNNEMQISMLETIRVLKREIQKIQQQ